MRYMNATNVVHGEEDRKIHLGSSDFLTEKEMEGICKCY